MRSVLPLLPALCIGIAGWWLMAQRYLIYRAANVVSVCITLCVAVPFFSTSLRQSLVNDLTTTMTLASSWMYGEGDKAKVAREVGRLACPTYRLAEMAFFGMWQKPENLKFSTSHTRAA